MQHPDFWNRVKPSRVAHRLHWMIFDDSWVDEVSRGLQACRFFCWYPLYWPALRQMGSNMVSQAATLNPGSVPNDVPVNLNPLFCILLAPLYAHVVYPTLARPGIRFSPTRRIAAGFFCAAAGMAVAATIRHCTLSTILAPAADMLIDAHLTSQTPSSPSGCKFQSISSLPTAKYRLLWPVSSMHIRRRPLICVVILQERAGALWHRRLCRLVRTPAWWLVWEFGGSTVRKRKERSAQWWMVRIRIGV
jgi:hypothetical protein